MSNIIDLHARAQHFEESARHHGITRSPWDLDFTASDRDDLQRWLLVEHNLGSAADTQPAYFTTYESPSDAENGHNQQEYREDWDPVALVDLDTGTEYAIQTRIAFVIPALDVVSAVST